MLFSVILAIYPLFIALKCVNVKDIINFYTFYKMDVFHLDGFETQIYQFSQSTVQSEKKTSLELLQM